MVVNPFNKTPPFLMTPQKLSLEETLEDDSLCSAFLAFLKERMMSVCFELWLEIRRFENATLEEDRRKVYKAIYLRFFEKGCPDPMILPKPIHVSIIKYYPKLEKMKEKLPFTLFAKAKEELWGLMMWTCLPAFQLSEVYNNFETGKMDSTKTKFSREKAQKFFGHTLVGPLTRSELVKVYEENGLSRGKGKNRLNEELNFQEGKKNKKKKKKFHPVYGEVTETGGDVSEKIATENWTLQDPFGCSRCGQKIGGLLECRICGESYCEPCRSLTSKINWCRKRKVDHDFTAKSQLTASSSNGSAVGLWEMFEVG